MTQVILIRSEPRQAWWRFVVARNTVRLVGEGRLKYSSMRNIEYPRAYLIFAQVRDHIQDASETSFSLCIRILAPLPLHRSRVA